MICHLLGLTSSLVPVPKIKEKPCPWHSDYLSIKNLPTQLPSPLSPTQEKDPWRRQIYMLLSHYLLRLVCLLEWPIPLTQQSPRFCPKAFSPPFSVHKVPEDLGSSPLPIHHLQGSTDNLLPAPKTRFWPKLFPQCCWALQKPTDLLTH